MEFRATAGFDHRALIYRLNKELEHHYEIGRQLDDVCSNLQAKLQELKQAKWRDQLKQTRKQQQQQQQQKKAKESKSEKVRVSYTNFPAFLFSRAVHNSYVL